MSYQIDLGAWNSVFAVPAVIADKHLKLAGGAQLKIILWTLRHSGESFTTEDIANALSMHEADVRDGLQYWIQTGLLRRQDDILLPAEPPFMNETSQDVSVPSEKGIVTEIPAVQTQEKTGSHVKRSLSRPEKPDSKYLSRRMNEDEGVAFLMQSADDIFGRMTSNNDKATLLLIHEHDGLPVDVLIMLMQYSKSIGKCNMRYIEKTAIAWSEEEITTLEAAEHKIKQLTNARSAAHRLFRIIGVDDHSPTEKEISNAELWLNNWKLSDEMIRAAYEICVDNKGKYIPKYTQSILERWYLSGIRDVEQLRQQTRKKSKNKTVTEYSPTYDISEYESTSVLDEDWDD